MKKTTAGVIATFNQQAFAAEAVASLAKEADEVIVIDDASSDETFAVLSSLNFPNVKVLRNEAQQGVSWTFNRAIAATSADILLLQGGDDRTLPGRALAQAEALSDEAVSLVYSVPSIIDGTGRALPRELASEFLAKPDSADPLTFLFFEGNYICAPAAAFRRTDYEALGGFRTGLELLQDYALWLGLAAVGTVLDLGEPAVEYRKHRSNLSREYVGLDTSKRRRLAAEMEFARNNFVNEASAEILARFADHCGIEASWFAGLEREDQIALIQLSHPDKKMNRRGLTRLFELAGQSDGEARLRGLRLTPADLWRFSALSDHENLEDVGRALAVAKALVGTQTHKDIDGNSP